MTAVLEAEPVARIEWLTRAEVAAQLKVGLRTVDRLANDGALRRHYLGGSRRLVRFDAAQVRELARGERDEETR
jgi:excisionase family DNA binding protein